MVVTMTARNMEWLGYASIPLGVIIVAIVEAWI
jgi:hypothetical protein